MSIALEVKKSEENERARFWGLILPFWMMGCVHLAWQTGPLCDAQK